MSIPKEWAFALEALSNAAAEDGYKLSMVLIGKPSPECETRTIDFEAHHGPVTVFVAGPEPTHGLVRNPDAGTDCAVCFEMGMREPQVRCPSGLVCKFGHGGADSVERVP